MNRFKQILAYWRLALACAAYERARLRGLDLDAGRTRAIKTYFAVRPLTVGERMEVAEYVRAGGAICCGEGVEWLKSRVPAPWAGALQGWAYEHLGCRGTGGDHAMYADKIEALPLDRMPL